MLPMLVWDSVASKGAHTMTQGTAGEVIKEMVRCGGVKKKQQQNTHIHTQWISFPY